MDAALVHLGIAEGLLNGLQGATEEVGIQLLKTGTGNVCVEVNSLVQGIDLNNGLGAAGQCTLRSLTGCTQTTYSKLVIADVFRELAFEFLDEMVDHAVVKIFTSQMVVTDVDSTSNMPSSMVRIETAKVPPPKSKMSTLRSPLTFLTRP